MESKTMLMIMTRDSFMLKLSTLKFSLSGTNVLFYICSDGIDVFVVTNRDRRCLCQFYPYQCSLINVEL